MLDGAEALAVPTRFGQNLTVKQGVTQELKWTSFDSDNSIWFQDILTFSEIKNKNVSEKNDSVKNTLIEILHQANLQNPTILNQLGFEIETHLTFPRNWGLGSSSTLINSVASWANVDAFQLLWNSFKGSGYDIACAQNNAPIFYQIKDKKPMVHQVAFNPTFKENLFFVHLNAKQDSKEGIAKFRESNQNTEKEIEMISAISDRFLEATSLEDFDTLIVEHERIISSIIKLKPVKERLFPDYFGEIKSLGAWGGDFILATGNSSTPDYFKNRGFETILSYSEMVL